MEYGQQLTEGKTKIIYAHPDDERAAIMVQKDAISAGDGARKNVIPGKGTISNRTAANVFAALNAAGIKTHYFDDPEPATMIVARCHMLPLEVVMRRLATGSYCRRHPEVAEGTRFDPVTVEFFFKDDAAHDPQIDEAGIVERKLGNDAEVAAMIETGRAVFATLERLWEREGIQLVDLKIEFGRNPDGELIVADMIDNDSWRLWPQGDKSRMLDKQIYRNLKEVTDQDLEQIKQKYAEVSEITERFRPEAAERNA